MLRAQRVRLTPAHRPRLRPFLTPPGAPRRVASPKRYDIGRWDLSGLGAANPGGIDTRLGKIDRRVGAFERLRRSLDPKMTQGRFDSILRRIEGIGEESALVAASAGLRYAADTQSEAATALAARVDRFGATVGNRMLFFDLWWEKAVDERNAKRLAAGSGELRHHMEQMRRAARYTLTEPEEKIINTLDVTGASALAKLYDKITGAFRYDVRTGKGRGTRLRRGLTREEVSALVRSPSGVARRGAYDSLLSTFSASRGVLAEIYRSIALNWSDENVGMRGHASPISATNLGNDVDDSTVESLLGACRRGASEFRTYFGLKARMLGARTLSRYDLYAPAPAAAEKYTYDEAVRAVLAAFGRFSPELEAHARRVVDSNHIDSEVRVGKRDGAFCSSPTPRTVPYILLSYTGERSDVFTLAHEMGHAVHSMAASGRSIMVHDAPLPLAETASTFAELLLYDSLAAGGGDKAGGRRQWRRRQAVRVAVEHLDELYATVIRQSFFTAFEQEAHELVGGKPGAGKRAARAAGSATADDISDAYMAGLSEQFGRSVDVPPAFAGEWVAIPHFFHSPFYCYSYSFGNLLALALYQRYKKEGPSFAPVYTQILAAGGSKKPEDLLAEHGLDIAGERFWRSGFGYVRDRVRELGALLD